MELAEHHDCDEPYHGLFVGSVLFVVGWKTPTERFYRRSDRQEAARDAARTHQSMVAVATTALCHDAVAAFLGG